MSSLTNQIALITGAGTGIGRQTARQMAAEGAHVIVVGRREALLTEVAKEIADTGGRATVHACDLEDAEAAAGLGAWAVSEFGRVDVLVNNAGHSSKVRSVRYVGQAEWNSVFDVNVNAVYRLTQAVLPAMIAQQRGTIITVTSMAAVNAGLLGGAPYGAAKAAAWSFMRSINAELRNEGVRACTIVPAEVDTPILDNRPLPPDADQRATMMQPEDVAQAITLCATMPARTIVEQITLWPTHQRDVSADIAAARALKGAENS